MHIEFQAANSMNIWVTNMAGHAKQSMQNTTEPDPDFTALVYRRTKNTSPLRELGQNLSRMPTSHPV